MGVSGECVSDQRASVVEGYGPYDDALGDRGGQTGTCGEDEVERGRNQDHHVEDIWTTSVFHDRISVQVLR